MTTDAAGSTTTPVVAARLIRVGAGRWRVDGDQGQAQVADLAAQAPPAAEAGHLSLDLGGVGRANSAAVALLLEWQARLRACDNYLTLLNVPPSLHRLAALSNVDGLLGLADIAATASDDGAADASGHI